MAVFGYCNRDVAHPADRPEDLGSFRNRVKGYALLHGLDITKIFIEAPANAARPFLKRRRARKMLEQTEPGDTIIAPGFEQIFVSATDAVTTIDRFQNAGIALHIAAWGGDVLTKPRCDDIYILLRYLARGEKKSARHRTSTPTTTQNKGTRRGRTPFGYTIANGVRRENKKEQDAIRFMRIMKSKGHSYSSIAGKVEEQFGFSLSHMGVKKIIERQLPSADHTS